VSHSHQTWFTWLSGNWCLCVWVAWPCDHEVCIIWYQSLATLIRLYPSEIFVSCWLRKKKFLSIQFLLLLEFAAYKKKIVISLCYCSKYISSIKNKKKREKRKAKKKSFKKTFIGSCRRKLNKRKLDQINLELATILYSNYWGPNPTKYQIWGQLDIICFGFQIRVSSGLIHNVFASVYQTLS
jgi:hypothetical protein